MVNPNLQNYVTQARAAGQTDDQINRALLGIGWNQYQISEALGIGISAPQIQTQVPITPVQPSVALVQPPVAQPQPKPKKKGSLAIKIIVIQVVLFIVGSLVSAAVGFFFLRQLP